MVESRDLLHRPAPELVADEVLVGMERDGWTPTQVRDLIRSYRAVVEECARLNGVRPQYARCNAFALVETELREFAVTEVRIYPERGAAITQCRFGGKGLTLESSESVLGAVDALRRLRHG